MDQNSKEKKLFFFGQPGCLKVKFDIPIRPNETEDRSNSDENSENKLNDGENTLKKPEISSDDDGQELLKKIDEVLEGNDGTFEHRAKDLTEEISTQNSSQENLDNSNEESLKESPSKKVSEGENDKEKSFSALESIPSTSNKTITVVNNDVKNTDDEKSNENLVVEKTEQNELVLESIKQNYPESIENVTSNEIISETEHNENLSKVSEISKYKLSVCNENIPESTQPTSSLELSDCKETENKQVKNDVEVASVPIEKVICESEVLKQSQDTHEDSLITKSCNSNEEKVQDQPIIVEDLENKQNEPLTFPAEDENLPTSTKTQKLPEIKENECSTADTNKIEEQKAQQNESLNVAIELDQAVPKDPNESCEEIKKDIELVSHDQEVPVKPESSSQNEIFVETVEFENKSIEEAPEIEKNEALPNEEISITKTEIEETKIDDKNPESDTESQEIQESLATFNEAATLNEEVSTSTLNDLKKLEEHTPEIVQEISTQQTDCSDKPNEQQDSEPQNFTSEEDPMIQNEVKAEYVEDQLSSSETITNQDKNQVIKESLEKGIIEHEKSGDSNEELSPVEISQDINDIDQGIKSPEIEEDQQIETCQIEEQSQNDDKLDASLPTEKEPQKSDTEEQTNEIECVELKNSEIETKDSETLQELPNEHLSEEINKSVLETAKSQVVFGSNKSIENISEKSLDIDLEDETSKPELPCESENISGSSANEINNECIDIKNSANEDQCDDELQSMHASSNKQSPLEVCEKMEPEIDQQLSMDDISSEEEQFAAQTDPDHHANQKTLDLETTSSPSNLKNNQSTKDDEINSEKEEHAGQMERDHHEKILDLEISQGISEPQNSQSLDIEIAEQTVDESIAKIHSEEINIDSKMIDSPTDEHSSISNDIKQDFSSENSTEISKEHTKIIESDLKSVTTEIEENDSNLETEIKKLEIDSSSLEENVHNVTDNKFESRDFQEPAECSSNLIQELSNEKDQEEPIKIEQAIEIQNKTDVLNDPVQVDIVPQKMITVESLLNENINDSQVELSKNDNKSFCSEKSSTNEIIPTKNEFSEDLNELNRLPIEKEHEIKDSKSVLQIVDKIQETSNAITVEKVDIQEESNKIELQTKKQYNPVVTDKHENILIDRDIKQCNENTKSVENESNLEESMVVKEMVREKTDSSLDEHDNIKKVDTPEQCTQTDPKLDENDLQLIVGKKESEEELKIAELEAPENLSTCTKLNDAETILNSSENTLEATDQKKVITNETVIQESEKSPVHKEAEIDEQDTVHPPVDPLEENTTNTQSKEFDSLLNKEAKLDSIPITKSFQKPSITRKRKLTERKSISESDSDGASHFVTDSVSNEKSSDEEETVVSKKPRIRNKITATRNTRATRQSPRTAEIAKPESKEDKKKIEVENAKSEEKTLQSLKFDYDENEDVVANIAAIKTLICKDAPKKDDEDDGSSESSADESTKKKPIRKGQKGKRARISPKKDAQESSSDDVKSTKLHESKRTKTSPQGTPDKQSRKKGDITAKGMLKHIDKSLVIETVETETPVRQSRRIAQQKIREETERRQMEEKMLKQMKDEAERKKKLATVSEPGDEDEKDDSSDESYQDARAKKKKKLKPTEKSWQTSSSHSEKSESEDEFERPRSEDPGSPLFRSDHEFSPESDDDDDATPAQPVKRARTAKKQVEESSSDDEDVNPNHACQVCHKTDCPEWILLCDECDHGYHCSCLKPIIFCIPSGNWYCPLCCHKKLVDNLSSQLEKLDVLMANIKSEEIRQQKQLEAKKLTEITQENILRDKRKHRAEQKIKEEQSRNSRGRNAKSDQESESNDGDSSDNSSDNEPLNEYFYKLRRRNQTTTSYRFNDYDDLINSAIRRDMEEVKGMGNEGRGKDISTIIEADKEEKKQQKLEEENSGDEEQNEKEQGEQEGDESSGSDVIRPKKSVNRKKKKNRKLNNLDETSEEDKASDEDFKGSGSTNSDTDEEYSVSGSVSESSLDLPLKKGKSGQRSTRSAARNRRYDETFIDDNSSDNEPLIKKRIRKQVDSDEEDFDANDEENSDASTAEDIDSDDLCDDTDTDDSSESNWPKKKKKRVASYDIKKPRKPAKKSDGSNDKAFRAGISKKKILKQSDNESEGSDNESAKGRRKTRGKKLLYLIEDDYESDDGIKPGIGVVRPETPPEERELFFKKQEEIKRMLAEKNTEAARQLAVPTIEPLKFAIEKPYSPSPPPLTSSELESLSTIPKNVIEGAKALDMDYNKIKSIQYGAHSKLSASTQDMSEEDLARMMEEEDFAQHQLRLVGESIGRNKLLDLQVKEEAFAGLSKGNKLKEENELEKPPEVKKRGKKPKSEKQIGELPSPHVKSLQPETAIKNISSPPATAQPLSIPINALPKSEPIKITTQHSSIPSVPPLIPGTISHPPYLNLPQRFIGPHNLGPQDRPSVLSSYPPRNESMPRFEGFPPRMGDFRPRFEGMPQVPQHLRFPPPHNENFLHKSAPILPHLQPQSVVEEVEEKKKGRRKKYTPLRTDLPESNVPKVAKLDTPTASVIQPSVNLASEEKSKITLAPSSRTKAPPPEIFSSSAPSPSVITRLLQPQQRPPFGGFVEQIAISSPNNPNQPPNRPFPEDTKHHQGKQVRPPPGQFAENPFVPRGMHPLYRGPPTSQPSIYGIPSHHARIPYPFHHLHPSNNLRPNMQEYGAPYNIPAQFGYYAPPAHSRHPSNAPISHPDHPDIPPNSARANPANPNEEPSESSEFGGLVSYFSSQQELD